MSLLDNLRKNLSPELFQEVTDQLGDDFDYDLVPRSRLNKVIKQRNALRDQQIEDSQASKVSHNEHEDDDDIIIINKTEKTKTGADIELIKQQMLEDQKNAINDVKLQYAALTKLREAKAIDPELIWKAGLIDKTSLVVGDDDSIEGLDEAIKALAESKAHLFGAGTEGAPAGTGKTGGSDDFTGITSKKEFLELPTDKQVEFKNSHPDVFKSFINQ